MPQLSVHLESADLLSPAASDILGVGAADAYSRLVVRGGGNEQARQKLDRLAASDLLVRPAKRPEVADALLAGLWLWHDWLDQSHMLSQSISSSTGSFWHAIMHRREGDFSNSKYWYARCGGHPAHARFLTAAADLLSRPENADIARRLRSGRDGYALVDLAEEADGRADDAFRQTVVTLQRLEWGSLFEETLRMA